MFLLQRAVPPLQKSLNHAAFPLGYQVLWLATLLLFGAASAYLSRRAGGSRSIGLIAVLFPAIVMAPLWTGIATRMNHPSPRQWFGLFCGVMNWIVLPGTALLLGALPVWKAQVAEDLKKTFNTRTMNTRTRTFWLPALASLTAAMVCLAISTFAGLQPRFVARGLTTLVVYIPWLLMLPLCGAAGAYLSHHAGGKPFACLSAGLFPVIALTILVGFLTLIGKFVLSKPQWPHLSTALLLGAILPGLALLVGATPFARASRLQESSPTA
ncbi:MAG: hypothetical protein WA188_05755 [Terriglobales bacterium]